MTILKKISSIFKLIGRKNILFRPSSAISQKALGGLSVIPYSIPIGRDSHSAEIGRKTTGQIIFSVLNTLKKTKLQKGPFRLVTVSAQAG